MLFEANLHMLNVFKRCWDVVVAVARALYEFLLISPRPQFQENAQWVICRWPFVVIRVFRFGLTFGTMLGFLLFVHILHTMHACGEESNFILQTLCVVKVLIWLPVPYFCYKKNQQLDTAERQPNQDSVGRALCTIIDSNRGRDRMMLMLLYLWIGLSLFFTYTAKDDMSQAVWNHAVYATFFMVIHRMACTILFVYWSQGKQYDVMSKKVLEEVSFVLTVVSNVCDTDKEILYSSTESCTICYCDMAVGEQVRKLTCSHHFHKDCVDEWLLRHYRRCPLCQRNPETVGNPETY